MALTRNSNFGGPIASAPAPNAPAQTSAVPTVQNDVDYTWGDSFFI
jgi:hypothetical protein